MASEIKISFLQCGQFFKREFSDIFLRSLFFGVYPIDTSSKHVDIFKFFKYIHHHASNYPFHPATQSIQR